MTELIMGNYNITLVLFLSAVSSIYCNTIQKFATKQVKNHPNLKQCIKVKSRESPRKTGTSDSRSISITTIYANICANLSSVGIAKLLYYLTICLKTKSPIYFLIVKNNLDLKFIFLEYFQLPSDFGSLSKLKILGLTGNQFVSFPEEILSLESLEKLYIGQDQGSKFTHVSEHIWRLQVSLPK